MTREEKIKGLYSLKECLVENPIEIEGYKSLPITLIDYAIQALEQQPKTGHFIRWYEQKENDYFTEYIPHCKCSECGKEYDSYSSQFMKYCSVCGAKMIKLQDSEVKE